MQQRKLSIVISGDAMSGKTLVASHIYKLLSDAGVNVSCDNDNITPVDGPFPKGELSDSMHIDIRTIQTSRTGRQCSK